MSQNLATPVFPEPPERATLKIDFETLPFNDASDIVELLDDTQSRSSPTDVPIPLGDPSNLSRPECLIPFDGEIDLPAIVKELLSVTEDVTSSTLLFNTSEEAAAKNWNILRDHDFDLTKIICKGRSHTSFGSELKRIDLLDKLWWKHPRWKRLRRSLTNGVTFLVRHLDEELRRKDLVAAFARGNHKSAIHKKCFLKK